MRNILAALVVATKRSGPRKRSRVASDSWVSTRSVSFRPFREGSKSKIRPSESVENRTWFPRRASPNMLSLFELQTVSTVESGRRSEEHTSELQSLAYLVCRLLLEKKKK